MATTSANLPIDVYARVSKLRKSKQAARGGNRELSTAGQVAVCRARLAERGLPEGKVLIDPGRSAWNTKVKRKDWDELMDRLETGVSGGVIMFDLERFSRQPEDGERLIRLASRGIAVLDSESDYDLRTPNGKKTFRDAMTAAAYYSDRQATKVRRGLQLRALEGEPHGGVRPFGFEADRVTQREDEAAVLRDLTARFLARETLDSLIADLRARGILTTRGKVFTNTILRCLLTRERNCGRIIHTDPETGVRSVVSKLPGEPIISEDDFDRVCAIFASRRRGRPGSPSYLCSGVTVCGRPGCGKPLYGRPRADMLPYDDGTVRRHYWCANASGGCGRTAVDQRALDEVAEDLTAEILSDPCNTSAIEATARQVASEAARLDSEIADAEAVAAALADRLGRGEITLARYDIAVAPLDQRIARLKTERAALAPAEPQEIPQEASLEQWRRRWVNASPAERRDLLRMALRGKHLVVEPVEKGAGSDGLADVKRRVTVE